MLSCQKNFKFFQQLIDGSFGVYILGQAPSSLPTASSAVLVSMEVVVDSSFGTGGHDGCPWEMTGQNSKIPMAVDSRTKFLNRLIILTLYLMSHSVPSFRAGCVNARPDPHSCLPMNDCNHKYSILFDMINNSITVYEPLSDIFIVELRHDSSNPGKIFKVSG